MAKGHRLKTGHNVRWDTSQGPTRGKIVRKVTKTEAAGGHAGGSADNGECGGGDQARHDGLD